MLGVRQVVQAPAQRLQRGSLAASLRPLHSRAEEAPGSPRPDGSSTESAVPEPLDEPAQKSSGSQRKKPATKDQGLRRTGKKDGEL